MAPQNTQTTAQRRADSVSFRQLRLFVSIGRLNSVRKAAEECNLSQPAVTQALAKLEQQVGFKLVERRASGSYLNDNGEIFFRRAERFFAQIEQALVDLALPSGEAAAGVLVRRIARAQVKGLIAIVENSSFAMAAQSLDISPASLQRAARDLEASLRKPLFYRTAAGITVTPDGAELGRKMKLAVQEIEWGITELEANQGSFTSEIVIGAMPFGGSVLLASAIDDFVHAYPQVEIRILNENASVMLKSLRNGDVDLVIGLLPDKPNDSLSSEAFAQTPYSVVGRAQHPLLRKGKATVDDLMTYDWVVGTHGSSRRACFDGLFAARRGPQASIATCALPVIRHLLAGSDRLTLMTSYELAYEEGRLAAIPCGPIGPAPAIGVTTRAGWLPTRLHEDFIAIVRRRTGLLLGRPTPLKQVAT